MAKLCCTAPAFDRLRVEWNGDAELEAMNSRVDPRAKRLVSAGPIITAAS